MKKAILSFLGICSIFIFGKSLWTTPSEGENQQNNGLQELDENIAPDAVSEDLAFAGQAVPLSNPSIKRRFDIELKASKYWRYIATRLTAKGDKYFPVVEPILKKYGIPDDFKYIPMIESGFTNKSSYSGASGPWQLMPETARHYGLIINTQIDERDNLVKSTEAACKYLNHLHNQLHNWTLAAAAFNKGLDGIKNAVEKQNTRSYYKLKLNHQAQHYVFRILATKEVIENPAMHGHHGRSAHFHYSIPTFRIKITSSIANLTAFAKKHGISLQTLKAYNPWLKRIVLTTPLGRYAISKFRS